MHIASRLLWVMSAWLIMSGRFASAASPITELGTLGGDDSAVACDINDGGSVVGYLSVKRNPALFRGFLYKGAGVMRDLGTLSREHEGSYPQCVNNHDEVVG